MRYFWYGLFVCLIFFIMGFISFIRYVKQMHIPDHPSVSAIVVLTGEPIRIERAFELLENQIGEKIFISGVHHSVSKDILLQKIPIRQDLAECCIDIGYKALNTEGNAQEASAWAEKNNFHHVLIVTHDYHMPRTFLELQRINSTVQFIPYPIISHDLEENRSIFKIKILRVLLIEYLKILLLSIQLSLSTQTASQFFITLIEEITVK